jgi:8-oxo-dGTP diphosphatase
VGEDDGVVVGAAILRGGHVLAAQRAHPPALAGRWELPGGSVEPGEDEASALARECREELALAVDVGARLGPEVALPGGRRLRVRRCASADPAAEPVAREHTALRWVDADGLDDLDWLDADRALLGPLREALAEGALRPPGPASRPS